MEIKNNLEIRKANINHIENIASIEKFLWNEPIENRIEKLKWKSKSLSNTIVGAVAFLNDEMVGYRGIMFSKIKLNGQEFKLLHFADAVVHEKARGMSLLKKMNEFILENYKNEFDFSYIYFPNNVSGHIYRSQGHNNFQQVQFFRRCMVFPISFNSMKFQVISDSNEIKNTIVTCQNNKETFKIIIDEDFIRWKQMEPQKKYDFYVSMDDKSVFVWLEIKSKSIEIQMLNYDKLQECLELAKCVARKNSKFLLNLPIIEYQDKNFSRLLTKKGFYKWGFMNKLRANTSSHRPILSKKLNDNLSPESIEIFNNQTLWEYHNITFV